MIKAQQVQEYLKKYPTLTDWLYFNTIVVTPGNTTLLTDSDNKLGEYIDGTEEREYLFSVAMIKTYDPDGTSDINMDAMSEVEHLVEWIDSNNELNIYPDFGEKCTVEKVEVVTEIPNLTIDTESNAARYVIRAKVLYTERSE